MDNPMDPGFLNIPARADTSATSDPSSMTADPDLIKGIDDKKRIAQLEHEIFTVCKQLDERSEKLKETQQQNAVLKERVVSLEQEKVEKAQFVESLVQSRDNLIFEKTQLQNDKLSLERRKDEIEVQISKLTNDKRRHLDEIEQLKKQCDADQADKIELQMQLDDFRSEKAALAYEKEQWNREKEILLMSKQWYMNEISNREQQINELRIQAIRDKSGMQREITLLNERNNELAYSNEQFTKQLAEREKELAEVQEKFRQVMDENTARIGELETELRTWERLSNVYKEASQAAEKEIEELRESEARLEALLKDKEEVIQEIALELEQSKEKHAAEIKAKDQEIKRLSDEITKSTELLNAGFRLNRPDEEISRLSPAAAAASSLLKSGMSLTAIYAEHCRVVSELERKNAEYNQMERYVKEVIQDLDSKAPQFREQRKTYDKMCERNECLRLQNELLSKERQKFQSQADSLHREMAFIKRELERYQREHQLLRMQNKRLLYVAEKGAAALDHSHMNGDSIQDQYLYSSIDELQARNLELAEELERLRDEQDKIIENYHNTEIETLKQARNLAEEQLSRLNENYAKQELMIREISEQRDQYKSLYDQLVQANNAGLSPNASTASDATQSMQRPQSVGSMQADLILWRTKAERLQETLAYLTDDRQTHERILNDRIDQQLEQISTMRNTIGKLQSDVEFQNKNQQLLAKQTDSYALDLKKSQDQLSEAKRQVETLQFKCDSLVSQLLERQQELSMLKVQNHSQSEQLQISTSREQRMHAELDILRSSQYNSERISTTLQGMESLLKRVDAEKAHSIESQLQSALLERDSLRQLVENLNEQHNQLVMGLKTTLNETCSERDRAQFDCKSVQSRLDAVERLYEQLKKENEKLQSEMEQIQSTDTNVEACKKEMHQMKNTIAYHEKQLAEYEHKCEELNSTIERKDKQLEEICRLGTDMEGTIQFGTLERQRMQAVREQLEHDVQNSKSLVEELRNSLAAKEMELLNQAKELSAVNHQLQEFQSQHDQQLMEKEGMLHEANLLVEQLQGENQGLKTDSETLTAKCGEMSETNLRLASDLAKEIATTEKLTQEIAQLKSEHASRCDSLQRSIDALQQEKFRLQDELKAYAARDEEHVKKHDSLYDEIQKLLKQIEFMERLQNTISSPSPNVSLNTSMMNVSSMTAATFSPGTSRLSLGGTADTSSIVGGQQQHTDRINTIIGYMRTEKQKETELRMNAELELQRIRAQAGMDQQKIFDLEAQMVKLRNEAEANANAAVEKEQLLTRLNALNDVQARYQQLKKTFDELSQQYTQLGSRTQELDGQLLKLQAEKKNLETRLESATKLTEDRAQQNKGLRERCERAMAMASKYSPDIVNSLQGENEKLKSEAAQRDSELALLRKECGRLSEELAKLKNEHTALTEKHNALVEKRGVENTQLATVKQLARKLRDEKTAALADNVKIQSELKSVQDELARLREAASAAAAAATASPTPAAAAAAPTLATTPTTIAQARKLQEQVAALTKEKEELTAKVAALVPLESERDQLKAQLERMQRELDDSAEKVMRVDMVEKAYGNSQQRIGSLSAEVRQLQEENQQQRRTIEELEQQLNLLQQNIRERERQAAESAALADVPAPHTPVTFNFAEQQNPNNPFAGQQQQQKEEEQSAEKQQGSNAQQHHFGHQETPASPLQPQSPTSPPTFPDKLQQEQLQQEQAILDELTKEDAENPNVGVGDELGEALLDIEETEEPQQQLLDPQQLQLEEEEFIQKPQQQPIGEIDQPAADEEYRSEEDFGDKVPNESEGAGMGGGEEEVEEEDNEDEEDFEEEGEEPIGISDEDEEGEEAEGGEAADESGLMDESGDFSYEGGGEGEEGGEADSSFEMGEPPRKQRRMHPGGGGQQQGEEEEEEEGMEGGEQQQQQGSNMESTSAQPPAADDDDDDDIQLL